MKTERTGYQKSPNVPGRAIERGGVLSELTDFEKRVNAVIAKIGSLARRAWQKIHDRCI